MRNNEQIVWVEKVPQPFVAVYKCDDCGRPVRVPVTQQELVAIQASPGVLELLDCYKCDCPTFHLYIRFEPNDNHENKRMEVKKVGNQDRTRGRSRERGRHGYNSPLRT